jgi:predicted GIY-YIG superfamily endonuclease
MPFYDSFEIDIVSALSDQLIGSFSRLTPAALTEKNLEAISPEQGVYILHKDRMVVYVGKADNLARRLSEHLRKLKGRRNIDPAEIGFECVYVHRNWTALAPETAVISHYRAVGQAAWNFSGFGSHDPGRNREETNKEPQGFDSMYPIRDDWVCDFVSAEDWNVRELLLELKRELPFLLRFEVRGPHFRAGHPRYNEETVRIPRSGMSARELLALIAGAIPPQEGRPPAQATIFPSHMILYFEDRDYRHGETIRPSKSELAGE